MRSGPAWDRYTVKSCLRKSGQSRKVMAEKEGTHLRSCHLHMAWGSSSQPTPRHKRLTNGLETPARGEEPGELGMRMDHLQEESLKTNHTPSEDAWGLWGTENSGLSPDPGPRNDRQAKSATRLLCSPFRM